MYWRREMIEMGPDGRDPWGWSVDRLHLTRRAEYRHS